MGLYGLGTSVEAPAATPGEERIPLSPEPEPLDPLPTHEPPDDEDDDDEDGDEDGDTSERADEPPDEAIMPIHGSVFVDGASPYDVRQTVLGDCYLLASLAAIAHTHPEIIEGMISRAGGYHDSYVVRFPRGSDPVRVTNLFPARITRYTRDDGTLSRVASPMYGQSTTPGELWVSILEKAFTAAYGATVADAVATGSLALARRRFSIRDLLFALQLRCARGYEQSGRGFFSAPVLEWLTGGDTAQYLVAGAAGLGADALAAVGLPVLPDAPSVRAVLDRATANRWPTVLETVTQVTNPERFRSHHAYALLAVGLEGPDSVLLYESNSSQVVVVTLAEIVTDVQAINVCVPRAH